ncbi:choice-of-anchor D domain-containing protein [Winogradskyella echinorum]|uniref:Choice-of-anchor D domain-containing protein n=1 Tax=Winogradskyella echinorum TaxID=538189 RepID=A0ABR6XYJ2_9FLAO|nr:choice-of-anchor D domain-containing protein [Winogradskyella echinorum]MBC3845552.1 choice-of-anchor D domain-containing protein [Winogradskyella echinorum]MBC5749900.1 choice-of-anchor D domain-containing protein [Winogradskyella echinorum]
MKKKYSLIFIIFLCFVVSGYGQGSESFSNLNAPGGGYGNGTYTGDNGVTWTYNGARSVTTTYNITGRTIGFSSSGTRNVSATSDANGVGDLNYTISSYFTGGTAADRTIEIYVGGNLYETHTLVAEGPDYSRTVTVNETGAVLIEFRSVGTRQIVIDDVSWTPATTPDLTISGTTDHGSSCISVATTSQTYTITNTTALTTALNVAVSSDDAQFVVGPLSNTTILPGATATFDVTFTPTATGAQTATLTVTSDNATGSTMDLDGTGINIPTISTQPTNQTEQIPNTATFNVTSGDTSSYQWQVSTDGGTIWNNVTGGTGATTDSYTTGATSAAMDGNLYRCILTNACGSTNSNSATLNVTNSSPSNAQNLEGCFEDTSVILSWNNPATPPTGGYIIFALEGTTDPSAPTNDASTFTANANYNAAPFETLASLGKVVYKGNGTTATVTGLTEDLTYSFRIFAYNGESLTGWSNGASAGSNEEGIAQGDIRNFVPTPLTNQVTLNWLNPTPISCWDEILIVANQGAVAFTPTGDGSAYTANPNYAGANQVVYKGTGNVVAVTGLTNGTNYCFRAFIRRGTTWTTGVEVCAVPSLTYCASSGDGTDGYLTLINNVEFNTIDNPSSNADNDYSDYTSISTTVTLGETYNLDVRVNTDGAFTTTTMAWIDWNNDGDFSDSNEAYDLGLAYNAVNGSTDASPLAIEIPTNAAIAVTRMRISTKYYDTDFPIDPPTPCETGHDGEVEDYNIIITQPANAEINIKGNNITIEDGFNAPYGLNNTLFGSTNVGATSPEKSYFVENIGASTLTLSGAPRVELVGAHPGDFNITLQPSATVGSLADSEFRIEFSPTADGTRTATVRIVNNDSDENPYEFDIEGTAVCSTVLTSTIWPTEGPENTEVTITSATDLTGATATINGLAMPVVSSNATELVVLVPAGAIDANIVVDFSTGCSSNSSFDVIDTVISGCETAAAATVPSDLFISEVSDATSGSSSIIEIFNGTASNIDLSDYSIRIFNNGSGTPSTTANLTGVLAPGGIHVISVGTTSCDLSGNGLAGGLPHQSFNSAGGINFDNNSSDAFELYNSTTATSIDVFGELGSSTWANGLGINGDGVNYRRQNTATPLPSTTFDLSQWDEIDWTTCGDSDYSDFGVYDFSLGVPPTVSVLNAPVFDCTSAIQLSITATEGVANGFSLAYQWYYLAPNASTFVVVPNNVDFNNVTSTTLDIINPIAYNGYQFYCQVRENSATCYQASNAVKLEVTTTVWDGTNWSSLPALDKVAIIDANYDTSVGTNGETSFEACQCIVNNGSTLTIENNTYVLVDNDLTVNGNIVVKTDGSFVQIDDSASILGDVLTDKTKISVEKETAPLASHLEYTYWSSPVVDEVINEGLFEANATRIFSFSGQNFRDSTEETNNDNTTVLGQDDIDDDANDWQYVNGSTVMESGVGYAATHNPTGFIPARYIYTFEGPFHNGVYNIPIYRNDNELNDNNWNFIGNPYPSAIAIDGTDGFLSQNASTIDNNVSGSPINGAIFLWSHNTAADGNANGNENFNFAQSDYAIINGSGQTAGGDGVTPNRFIPSGQGFFVSMDDGATATPIGGNIHTANVVFNNSMRVTANNNQFFRGTNTNEANRLWLDLTSDNGIFNQILVAYVDGATDSDDGAYYDAYKNLSSELYSGIYSLIDDSIDKKFAIQGKDPNSLTLEEVIPLGFNTTIDVPTIYSISIHEIEGAFMTENTIYLRDDLLNITQNLTLNNYTFTSETGEFNDRFEIVFTPSALSIDDNLIDANELTIIEQANGDVLFKVSANLTITNVEIIDITGRQIYNLRGNNSTEVYNLSRLSNAAYIANVALSNGQVITKKAIKQR